MLSKFFVILLRVEFPVFDCTLVAIVLVGSEKLRRHVGFGGNLGGESDLLIGLALGVDLDLGGDVLLPLLPHVLVVLLFVLLLVDGVLGLGSELLLLLELLGLFLLLLLDGLRVHSVLIVELLLHFLLVLFFIAVGIGKPVVSRVAHFYFSGRMYACISLNF